MRGGIENINANHLYKYYSFGQQMSRTDAWGWRVWGYTQSSEYWRLPFLFPAHLDVVLLCVVSEWAPCYVLGLVWEIMKLHICACIEELCWRGKKKNDCFVQVGTTDAIPVPPSPCVAGNAARGITSYLQVKVNLKKNTFSVTVMKSQNPFFRAEKNCVALWHSCFPALRESSSCK